MKWLFWRRKARTEPHSDERTAGGPSGATTALDEKDNRASAAVEPQDVLLRFARDYLVASGARVRVEEADLLTAVLPDDSPVRYTTSLTRARAEEGTRLLVEGGGALAALVDESAERARIVAVQLAAMTDAGTAARSSCVEPPVHCGLCVEPGESSRGEVASPHCEACPLREGRFALRGIGQVGAARVVRQWESHGVELAYRLVTSDRHGRREEWTRVAVDCETGRRLDPVTIDAMAFAQPATPSERARAELTGAVELAERELTGPLTASASFLRLRSLAEYQRRYDDIHLTHARLRREHPGEDRAIDESFARETERLQDMFAVDVSAALESVCFVTSPLALVSLRGAGKVELPLTVDLGRGHVLPPTCAECGEACSAGIICKRGHVTHAACRARRVGGISQCPVCQSGTAPTRATSPQATPLPAPADVRTAALSIPHVEDMTSPVWLDFVEWLAGQNGATLERGEAHGESVVWRGTLGQGALILMAVRPPDGWLTGEGDVRRVAALRGEGAETTALLLSTAAASRAAQAEADRLGVRLWDRFELARHLEAITATLLDAQARARREIVARADEARVTRDVLSEGIAAIEQRLTSVANEGHVRGGARVAAAVAALIVAHQGVQRALLAWDTLASDWLAAFGEHEGRDGALQITADELQLRELAQRAHHLAEAASQAAGTLAEAPGTGEMGYSAWRQAVIEELMAGCEALRWRVLTVDPTKWQDFATARDALSEERAAEAAVSAGHAAARTHKAYAELEARLRPSR